MGLPRDGKTVATTAGTAYQLASSGTYRQLTVQASVGNSGTIYVGNSTVSTSSIELSSGDQITFNADTGYLANFYILGTVNGDSVRYIYTR